MLRLGFLVREMSLAAAIACLAMAASPVFAGDVSGGKSTGGGAASAGKDGGRTEGGASRQTKSLYTFERGLNGELIVRDASGRRVGVGTRDDATRLRTQDR